MHLSMHGGLTGDSSGSALARCSMHKHVPLSQANDQEPGVAQSVARPVGRFASRTSAHAD